MWPRYPVLYEINTWPWLARLSRQYGASINLANVPQAEWDRIAELGFDAVWLMGVWERSPAGIAIANRNPGLLDDFRRALPDFRPEDNVGSPYCVRRYLVDPHLGGPEALAVARRKLAVRGMRLVLDFVPNHVAPDHPWTAEHPGYFIRGTFADVVNDPASFLARDEGIFACGRDPYFPAWPDVVQLNAFDAGLRRAAVETISDIAGQCDGVRCDMAMLFLNSVFEGTWSSRAGRAPAAEYWSDVIPAVRQNSSGFLFIAEAYWDLEWQLQQLGFDFCYDKTLYDRLRHGDAESIRLHLSAGMDFQSRLLRFIENHDEPRAADAFAPARQRAAAVAIATLPGARLFYEGQCEGCKVRLPVFLGRCPDEPVHAELRTFYEALLKTIDRPIFREGEWSLCRSEDPHLLSWTWSRHDERFLVVVNWSDREAWSRVHPTWNELSGTAWNLHDQFSGQTYVRDGNEMLSEGLNVGLPPWGYHFLDCRQRAQDARRAA
jgi:hypothetical protein